MLRIEFRGLEEFKLWIQRSPKELRKILIDTIDKASQEAYNISREKVPVRTGYLRSTIFILKPNPYEFVLGAYAHYARFVEFGTRRMSARPFIRPAIKEVVEQMKKGLLEGFKGLMRL